MIGEIETWKKRNRDGFDRCNTYIPFDLKQT